MNRTERPLVERFAQALRWLACLGALFLAGAAHAGSVLHYTVLFQARPSGEQVTTVADDGRVQVKFAYLDNGRGPDLREDIILAPDGTLRAYRATGSSTYGARIDERFEVVDDRAIWHSSSDDGERVLAGPAMYLPVESSVELYATMVRAALRVAPAGLVALPGGELHVVKAAELTLRTVRAQYPIALYALTGIGLRPVFVWLHGDGDMPLFASVNPGSRQIVARGFEAHAPELERVQQEAEMDLLRAIATRAARRFAEPILIRNVRVFDTRGGTLTSARDVYVHDGRIAAVYEAGSPVQDAATVIDGDGRALLPALFDMHAHEDPWDAVLQVAGGVTTVRDMGSENAALAELGGRIARSEVVGPRILAAGFIEGESPFSARGGVVVASLEEAKRAVDWYAQRGFRQIKLYSSFRPEWVAETARYAHQRGLRVSGHVPAFTTAEEVVRNGYDEIQHINQLLLDFFVTPQLDTRTLARLTLPGEKTQSLDLDSAPVQDFIRLLKDHGTVIDPTLATFEAIFPHGQGQMNPAFAMVADHMPVSVQRGWRANLMEIGEHNLAIYRASFARMIEFVGRLHAAGVPLLAGTDEIAGFTLHRELELYVQAGIPAGEVIRIATETGARYSGLLAELGTVDAHKRADLILVDGDPTRDISDIRRIALVLKDGIGYSPADLYEALGVKRFADPPRIATVAP